MKVPVTIPGIPDSPNMVPLAGTTFNERDGVVIVTYLDYKGLAGWVRRLNFLFVKSFHSWRLSKQSSKHDTAY